MRNLTIRIDSGLNIVPTQGDKFYLRQLVKEGQEFSCKLIKKRNLKHHKKYWALMNALSYHFGNTNDGWHLHFKAKFLPLVEFLLPNGDKVLYHSSTNFDKMNQLEFDEYYKKIEDHLIKGGYDLDTLIESMEV